MHQDLVFYNCSSLHVSWLHSQALHSDTKAARGMKTQWDGLDKLKVRLAS